MKPIDPNTLAAIGGQKTAEAARGFADTMMNLYQVRQQAKLQDMQMDQIQKQNQEWEANKDLRAKERQASIMRLESEMQLLPAQTRNALKQTQVDELNIASDKFDATMSTLRTVRGGKSYRKWKEDNKETLQGYFDTDEEFQNFMDSPFTVGIKDKLLMEWTANKEEMLEKRYLSDLEAKVAAAKAGGKGGIKASKPSVADFENAFASSIDADMRTPAAFTARDLIDLTTNYDLPVVIGSTEAQALTQYWADEIEAQDPVFSSIADQAPAMFAAKKQQFMNDIANGIVDPYVSIISKVPVETIQQIKQDYSHLPEEEIYRQIMANAAK